MVISRTTIDQIVAATSRVSLGNKDAQALKDYINMSQGKGFDITLHPMMGGSIKEAFEDGILVLTSASLDTDFLVVCINRGKGLFGGQKRAFATYVGSVDYNEFTPGPTHNSLLVALTSINNIFRAQNQ